MGLGRLILGKKIGKNGIIWEFFLEGGGDPLFPNVYVRILTKSEHFCKNQKCSLGPKMQNKLLIFFCWTDNHLPLECTLSFVYLCIYVFACLVGHSSNFLMDFIIRAWTDKWIPFECTLWYNISNLSYNVLHLWNSNWIYRCYFL